MNELNSLNATRKIQNSIVVEDAANGPDQIKVISEHKGIYFLSALVILLIAASAFSLSISLKTFAQLEASLADSKIILQTLDQHSVDIRYLATLMTENTSTELAQLDALKAHINTEMQELIVAIEEREEEFADIKIAHNDLKTSMQDSLYELKMSDKLMLEKFISLNDKVEKLNNINTSILNAY